MEIERKEFPSFRASAQREQERVNKTSKTIVKLQLIFSRLGPVVQKQVSLILG